MSKKESNSKLGTLIANAIMGALGGLFASIVGAVALQFIVGGLEGGVIIFLLYLGVSAGTIIGLIGAAHSRQKKTAIRAGFLAALILIAIWTIDELFRIQALISQ